MIDEKIFSEVRDSVFNFLDESLWTRDNRSLRKSNIENLKVELSHYLLYEDDSFKESLQKDISEDAFYGKLTKLATMCIIGMELIEEKQSQAKNCT